MTDIDVIGNTPAICASCAHGGARWWPLFSEWLCDRCAAELEPPRPPSPFTLAAMTEANAGRHRRRERPGS